MKEVKKTTLPIYFVGGEVLKLAQDNNVRLNNGTSVG